MGKKGRRKVTWRRLSIDDDSSNGEKKTGNHQAGAQSSSRLPPHPNSHHQQHHIRPRARARSHQPLVTTQKITFNEEEYTKITTPRQDVLFKKGYLCRKKPTPEAPVVNGDATNGNISADGSSVTTSEDVVDNDFRDDQSGVDGVDEQAFYPNDYIDPNGVYYGNGSYEYVDPYTGMYVMSPVYPGSPLMTPMTVPMYPQPLPLQPLEWFNSRVPSDVQYYCAMTQPTEEMMKKRNSTDSQTYSSTQGTESSTPPTGESNSPQRELEGEETNHVEPLMNGNVGEEEHEADGNDEKGEYAESEPQQPLANGEVGDEGDEEGDHEAPSTPLTPEEMYDHGYHPHQMVQVVPVMGGPPPYVYPGYFFGPAVYNINGVVVPSHLVSVPPHPYPPQHSQQPLPEQLQPLPQQQSQLQVTDGPEASLPPSAASSAALNSASLPSAQVVPTAGPGGPGESGGKKKKRKKRRRRRHEEKLDERVTDEGSEELSSEFPELDEKKDNQPQQVSSMSTTTEVASEESAVQCPVRNESDSSDVQHDTGISVSDQSNQLSSPAEEVEDVREEERRSNDGYYTEEEQDVAAVEAPPPPPAPPETVTPVEVVDKQHSPSPARSSTTSSEIQLLSETDLQSNNGASSDSDEIIYLGNRPRGGGAGFTPILEEAETTASEETMMTVALRQAAEEIVDDVIEKAVLRVTQRLQEEEEMKALLLSQPPPTLGVIFEESVAVEGGQQSECAAASVCQSDVPFSVDTDRPLTRAVKEWLEGQVLEDVLRVPPSTESETDVDDDDDDEESDVTSPKNGVTNPLPAPSSSCSNVPCLCLPACVESDGPEKRVGSCDFINLTGNVREEEVEEEKEEKMMMAAINNAADVPSGPNSAAVLIGAIETEGQPLADDVMMTSLPASRQTSSSRNNCDPAKYSKYYQLGFSFDDSDEPDDADGMSSQFQDEIVVHELDDDASECGSEEVETTGQAYVPRAPPQPDGIVPMSLAAELVRSREPLPQSWDLGPMRHGNPEIYEQRYGKTTHLDVDSPDSGVQSEESGEEERPASPQQRRTRFHGAATFVASQRSPIYRHLRGEGPLPCGVCCIIQ